MRVLRHLPAFLLLALTSHVLRAADSNAVLAPNPALSANPALAPNAPVSANPALTPNAPVSPNPALSPNALISPDGTRAVWIKEDASGFWLAQRSAPGQDWSPRKEISIRGVVRRPVFSPDGGRLAFENARGGYSTQDPNFWGPTRAYPWGFIAVYSFLDDRISYVDPSFAQDLDPHWSGNDAISYTRRTEGQADIELTAVLSPGTGVLTAGPSPGTGVHVADPAHKSLLETLLATPLLYQPARAADGRSLAFVSREAQARAIYFAPLGGTARALIRYDADDGQALSQIALSRDGALLAYVRGGEPNGKGEIPNPRSLGTPPRREIWLLSTTGTDAPQLLGQGFAPQFSPDGARLLWLTDRGVASAPVSRSGVDIAGFEILLPGPAYALRFSPDGRRIAYERSSHVEVCDLSTRAVWAVDKPPDAVDLDPTWSPDGRSLALRRLFGPQPNTDVGYAGEYLAPQPWAILEASATTRQVREIWRAADGLGSAYYDLDQDASDAGVDSGQLFWSIDNDIAFTWERDGWRHLYAVAASGGSARLLTPGEGEVETAALSLDRRSLIYSTNIGDLERRHIGAVAFNGGAPAQLTRGTTSQWTPVPMAGGSVAFIDAGWISPPKVMVRDASGQSAAVGGPAARGLPKNMVAPQPVSFPGTDGQQAYGQLFMPSKPSGCAIVFVHGGIRRQMLLGFHYMDAYSNLYEMNQYFAMRGCVVLSVEYRSSIMRGFAFRNAPGWGNGGASEYMDVLGGANYLKSRPDLHVARIGIYGLSWGGYLTAQALARNSDVFAAGFDMAGVHAFPGESFKYSPAAYADHWRSPVYIAAGDDDRNVDFNQSILLMQALQKQPQKVDIAVKVIPNEIHDLSLTFEDLLEVYWQGSEFMLGHLAPR